ncbi:MAG: hypothetical protein RMN52_04815 [Anaerolineae bacterium]|nr:hypothetical protein [Candidatus Roseilinea sp.]MDW8449304.1 hypothetical protein [Anaerolineae bacterium]
MKRAIMSRAQRREAFLALAGQAFDELESWYDAHPNATFAEIEARPAECDRHSRARGWSC